jgi:hypothetical protein
MALATVMTFVGTSAPVAWTEQAKPEANGVTVTVKYTGKGVVDANHRLWVWLFDDPNIGPGSTPIGEQSIDKNGGTASFTGVQAKAVYVAVAYDEAGGFGGNAPPPPGSPIALYGAKGPNDKPLAVAPGAKAAVTVAFADAQRMQ